MTSFVLKQLSIAYVNLDFNRSHGDMTQLSPMPADDTSRVCKHFCDFIVFEFSGELRFMLCFGVLLLQQLQIV